MVGDVDERIPPPHMFRPSGNARLGNTARGSRVAFPPSLASVSTDLGFSESGDRVFGHGQQGFAPGFGPAVHPGTTPPDTPSGLDRLASPVTPSSFLKVGGLNNTLLGLMSLDHAQ